MNIPYVIVISAAVSLPRRSGYAKTLQIRGINSCRLLIYHLEFSCA